MVESSRFSDLNDLARWPRGPVRPHYPTGEIHVWIGLLNQEWPDARHLPPDERERAAGFLRPRPARRWVASRWLLRQVLGRYLQQEPAAVELAVDESGKPRLGDPGAAIRFNLSHSGEVAVVAVAAGREVGVDVEEVVEGRDLPALAERALPAADAAAVRAATANQRAAVFYRAWACHEARLKCLGAGLSGAVPDVPVAMLPLDLDPAYAAAVAAAGGEPIEVRCWSLGPG